MTKQPPPVPPAARSDKGPGDAADGAPRSEFGPEARRNIDKQERQANIRQNTTNQGHQQDR